MNIKIEASNKVFSALGGLKLFSALIQSSKLYQLILGRLPALSTGQGPAMHKFKQLLHAFLAGADCLEDIDRLAFDPVFDSILEKKSYTAKTCGNFLRSFSDLYCRNLNQSLCEFSYGLRSMLPIQDRRSITIDIDSTTNRQTGKKMEGLGFSYKGEWGLDTILAFDELGLPYWCEVRRGNTYSSQSSELIIHEIFRQMPSTKDFQKLRRYVRADSAFCNSSFFLACLAKNAGFVVAMRANMLAPVLKNIRHWRPLRAKGSKGICFYDQRECEIGQTLYSSTNLPKPLRVVAIRAVKKGRDKGLIHGEEDYDYFSWITNIGEHEMSNEKLILFYRKRGQAENYIKDLKYGFDLRHYPCQKLTANKAYALIACFAYALMRCMGYLQAPKKPQYAKAVRFGLIYLPCQVVHHAGQVIFKFMQHHYKEVKRCLEQIHTLQPYMT